MNVAMRLKAAQAVEKLPVRDNQYGKDLIRRSKLHPLKTTPKNKLFLKSEILQRKWQ